MEINREKKWFITGDKKIRWVHTFIHYNNYDSMKTYIIVSMCNNCNSPFLNGNEGCRLEEIELKNFFKTKEECQFEIIRRERFEEKN